MPHFVTRVSDSRTMLPLIFDTPCCRSVNVIGVSTTRRHTQIGTDDVLSGPDGIRGPTGDDLAEIQDDDPIAHGQNEFHVVVDEEHRHAVVADGA